MSILTLEDLKKHGVHYIEYDNGFYSYVDPQTKFYAFINPKTQTDYLEGCEAVHITYNEQDSFFFYRSATNNNQAVQVFLNKKEDLKKDLNERNGTLQEICFELGRVTSDVKETGFNYHCEFRHAMIEHAEDIYKICEKEDDFDDIDKKVIDYCIKNDICINTEYQTIEYEIKNAKRIYWERKYGGSEDEADACISFKTIATHFDDIEDECDEPEYQEALTFLYEHFVKEVADDKKDSIYLDFTDIIQEC